MAKILPVELERRQTHIVTSEVSAETPTSLFNKILGATRDTRQPPSRHIYGIKILHLHVIQVITFTRFSD